MTKKQIPPESEKNKEGTSAGSPMRVTAAAAGAAVIFLLGIYAFGTHYYSTRLFRNTRINNHKVGGMTVSEAERVFTDDLASHEIVLKEKDRTESIRAEDAGVVINVGNRIQKVKDSQNKWKWPANFFGSKESDVKIDISYDEEKLTKVINDLECFVPENITAPQDTYLQAGEKEFEIVPEVLGNTVKKKQLAELVRTDLLSGVRTIDFEKEDLYKLPKYYQKDDVVKKALKTANQYSHAKIVYNMEYTKETLDYSKEKDWIKVSKDFAVTLDESKVGDYVVELGNEYNSMGLPRPFKTASGKKITIMDGDYGWKIDFKKEKKKLLKDLKAGKDVERDPVYSYKGVVRKSRTDDIGDTYVEVSTGTQEVWMFVDGKCILNSSCVTGQPSKHAETTKGIYSLTFKKSPAVLTGPNADGSSYSSDVTYWMPFNGNQGLHDAPWRNGDFGGSIYKTNGSHGCVNLPVSTAKTIYEHIEKGDPVIVY